MANSQSLATETQNVTGALTSMRIDELIANLAIGIAKGQFELDRVCMQIAEFMSKAEVEIGKIPGTDEPDRMSLIELGFTPNFYQFVDTILELRVSVSCSYEQTLQEDRSDMQYVNDEQQSQSSYSNSSSSSSSSHSSSWSGFGWWWWWGGASSSSSAQSSASASHQSGASSASRKAISMQTVDAKYSSTYNYSLEASSTVKTKIVPVPPPPVFEEVLRAKLAEGRERQKLTRQRNQGVALIKEAAMAAQHASDGLAAISNTGKQSDLDAIDEVGNRLAVTRATVAGLSNELWAAIGSVAERRSMDEALAQAGVLLSTMRGVVAEGTTPDDYEIAGAKADIANVLAGFIATANAVVARNTTAA